MYQILPQRGADMITITTQQQLDKFIQADLFDLEEFGIDITEDIIFHLGSVKCNCCFF